jgi:ribosomal protein S27E
MEIKEMLKLCKEMVENSMINYLDAKTEQDKNDYRESFSFFSQIEPMIEKSIRKKPIGDLHSVPHYRCPNCNRAIVLYKDDPKHLHCHWCGQALNWRGARKCL